ncbi:ubiquitin family protein [Spraguea lophii 42_110]|uniref:Ubiquitin family protein n=1 Tax=Spraguea lophii (strain 42_110) TaxID=1358809 RepID=S7WEA1_SPRLO|nr:ubiquitin family protein [Spraguea lophii 42_110]
MPMEIKLKVKYQNSIVEIIISNKDSLRKLKERIAHTLKIDIYKYNIVYKDRILVDEKRTVKDLDMVDDGLVSLKSKGMNVTGENKEDIFSSGAIKDVKGMFNNPDSIKNMLKLLPGMDEQINENPELRNILNDPATYEDMAKIFENPEYRQEMLKNVDLAMSKMENLPGGLNLMSGMMKAVEPMQNMDLGPKITFKQGEYNPGLIKEAIPVKVKKENFVVKYRNQLGQLRNYGFKNLQKNIKFLHQYEGDLESTIVALAEENE